MRRTSLVSRQFYARLEGLVKRVSRQPQHLEGPDLTRLHPRHTGDGNAAAFCRYALHPPAVPCRSGLSYLFHSLLELLCGARVLERPSQVLYVLLLETDELKGRPWIGELSNALIRGSAGR